MYDYSELIGKIITKYSTIGNFAIAMGISQESISKKLNCKNYWKQNQIEKACDLLNIPKGKIDRYFFKIKVQ